MTRFLTTTLGALALGCLTALSPVASAQAFLNPVEELPAGNKAMATLPDGTVINGRVGMVMAVNGNIKSLTLKGDDGTKHKLKAADISVLKVEFNGLQLAEAVLQDLDVDMKALLDGDFQNVVDMRYIIYEQALLPKKADKYALVQLLNPGWDHGIKVYLDPNADETNPVIGASEDKSYIVVKDGNKSVLVKKGQYKKEFYPMLFADCQQLTGHPALLDRARYKDFAVHVYIFEQACSEKPAAAETPAAAE